MLLFESLSSFVLSFIFIYFIMINAQTLGLLDIPNDRSSHKTPVPKGAGFGFTLAALLTFAFVDWNLFVENILTLGAIVLILLIGLIDDIRDCRPRVKLIALLFAVSMIYIDDCSINTLGTYFGVDIALPWILVFPFTYFAVAGFTNALNLIDGIDGLAAGVALVILFTLFLIGLKYSDDFIMLLAGSFSFALIAFLFFNWNPAKIFMGDSGSLTLGFVIAILSIKALEYINPTLILYIAALPIIDTMNVMLRRRQRHVSFFKADKIHMHHILLKQKRDVKFTALMLIMMQFVFSMIGYRSIGQDDAWNVFLFMVLFVIFFNLLDPRMRRREKTANK